MSRFQPGRDSRYPPRDRSPPRHFDRRASQSYQGAAARPEDDRARFSRADGPPFNRDSGRAGGIPAPRGRGFQPRELRDAPPLSDNNRSWRDTRREGDFRRDRRPSPRSRSPRNRTSPPRARRTSRERDYPPRDFDSWQGRRPNSRDGPLSATSDHHDPPPWANQSGRGGFGRGRGRGGDREYRGRGGRSYHPDDRDQFRPRSRSRERGYRERDRSRDSRDFDRRDDARFDRRDDDRRSVRDDRDTDRFRRDFAGLGRGVDARHFGGGSSGHSSPRPPSISSVGAHVADRDRLSSGEIRRENDHAKRLPVGTDNPTPLPRRETKGSEYAAGRELQKDRQRPSTPPAQVPSVPSFGSLPFGPLTTPTPSNVWRNPNLDKPKPIAPPLPSPTQPSQPPSAIQPEQAQPPPPAPPPLSVPSSMSGAPQPPPPPHTIQQPKVLPTAPVAPKALLTSIAPSAPIVPPPAPTGPRADRAADRQPADIKEAPASRESTAIRTETPPKGPRALTLAALVGPPGISDRRDGSTPRGPSFGELSQGPVPRTFAPPTGPQAASRPPPIQQPPTGPQAGPRPPLSLQSNATRPPLPPQPANSRQPPPSQAFSRSPQAPHASRAPSPANPPPIGPRASMETSPKPMNPVIPTGPRADRGPPFAPRGPNADRRPVVTKNLQWFAPGKGPNIYNNRPPIVPAKRDFSGEEKQRFPTLERRRSFDDRSRSSRSIERPMLSPAATTGKFGFHDQSPSQLSMRTAQTPEPFSTRTSMDHGNRCESASATVPYKPKEVPHYARSEPSNERPPEVAEPPTQDQSTDVQMTEAPDPAETKPPVHALPVEPAEPSDEDDAMDLDEEDFKDNETRYNQELTKLRAKLVTFDVTVDVIEIEYDELLEGDATEFFPEKVATPPAPIEEEEEEEVEPQAEEEVEPQVEEDAPKSVDEPDMLTPKEEQEDDHEDVSMDDAEGELEEPSRSPSPYLPYLGRGPPTPLSDPDQELRARNDEVYQWMTGRLTEAYKTQAIKDETNREDYREIYSKWRQHADAIEEEMEANEERQKSIEPGPLGLEAPALGILAAPALMEGRRGLKFGSDYDLQRVLQLSAAEAKEKEERSEREQQKSKPDLEKEAEIPELCEEAVPVDRTFNDTNHLWHPAKAEKAFQYLPPIDDFTYQEHQMMVQKYHENPKKWSRIASSLDGRGFKECINHYYATKWDKEYKEYKSSRRGRGGKRGRGGRAGRVSAISAVRTETYDGDEANAPVIAITDTGRPRRAAAPTWPPKDDPNALLNQVVVATPGRKSTAATGEPGAEKGTKRRRNAAKEKAPAKGRGPTLAAKGPLNSPMKFDKERKDVSQAPTFEQWSMEQTMEPSLVRTPGALSVLVPQLPEGEQMMHNDKAFSPSLGGAATPLERPKVQGHSSRGAGASSYWSRQEKDDTVKLLRHFGTDFHAISTTMNGSKTAQMVKNYYEKMVKDGRADQAFQDDVADADGRRERGEALGPPPAPSVPGPPRRRYGPDASNPPPRAIAPHTEAMELDASPPGQQPNAAVRPQSPPFQQPNRYASQAQQPLATPPQAPSNQRSHIRTPSHGPKMGYFNIGPTPQAQPQPAPVPTNQHMSPQAVQEQRYVDPDTPLISQAPPLQSQQVQAQQLPLQEQRFPHQSAQPQQAMPQQIMPQQQERGLPPREEAPRPRPEPMDSNRYGIPDRPMKMEPRDFDHFARPRPQQPIGQEQPQHPTSLLAPFGQAIAPIVPALRGGAGEPAELSQPEKRQRTFQYSMDQQRLQNIMHTPQSALAPQQQSQQPPQIQQRPLSSPRPEVRQAAVAPQQPPQPQIQPQLQSQPPMPVPRPAEPRKTSNLFSLLNDEPVERPKKLPIEQPKPVPLQAQSFDPGYRPTQTPQSNILTPGPGQGRLMARDVANLAPPQRPLSQPSQVRQPPPPPPRHQVSPPPNEPMQRESFIQPPQREIWGQRTTLPPQAPPSMASSSPHTHHIQAPKPEQIQASHTPGYADYRQHAFGGHARHTSTASPPIPASLQARGNHSRANSFSKPAAAPPAQSQPPQVQQPAASNAATPHIQNLRPNPYAQLQPQSSTPGPIQQHPPPPPPPPPQAPQVSLLQQAQRNEQAYNHNQGMPFAPQPPLAQHQRTSSIGSFGGRERIPDREDVFMRERERERERERQFQQQQQQQQRFAPPEPQQRYGGPPPPPRDVITPTARQPYPPPQFGPPQQYSVSEAGAPPLVRVEQPRASEMFPPMSDSRRPEQPQTNDMFYGRMPGPDRMVPGPPSIVEEQRAREEHMRRQEYERMNESRYREQQEQQQRQIQQMQMEQERRRRMEQEQGYGGHPPFYGRR